MAAALLLSPFISAVLAAPAQASPALHWGACPPGSQGRRSAAAMRCGWLKTGARLAGRPVRLRVVVLQARPGHRDPSPVVYLPGGPGEPAGLDAASLRAWRVFQQRTDWAHDIILFDPRGTGASRPRLSCAYPDARAKGARQTRTGSQTQSARRIAAACYARLGPVTARALGPKAQLTDLSALIAALGARRVNLWSVSYATRLALLYTYRHPQRVHTLVADSLVPFGRDPRLAAPAQIHAALAQLDTYCAAHPRCARAGATPQSVVQTLLARYAQRPPALTARSGERPLIITPYRLLMMLLYAGYQPAAAADTITRLRRAATGHARALAPLTQPIRAQQQPSGRSRAVFWSTRCAFETPLLAGAWRQALAAVPRLAPYLAKARPNNARADSVCAVWAVPPAPTPARRAPLPVPTLVLAGGRDILIPPGWPARFVRQHARARLLDIPNAGHMPSLSSACAWQAMARFWSAPAQPPALACAKR